MEAAFGGLFVRARASLGLSSFGIQVAEIPPNSGDMYPEHDHEYDGQEELYLLLRGSADLHLPGRVVALDPDTFVRVGPLTRRRLRSGRGRARADDRRHARACLRAAGEHAARRAGDAAVPDRVDVAGPGRPAGAAALSQRFGQSHTGRRVRGR